MLQLSVAKFQKGSMPLIEGTPNSGRFYIIQQGQVKSYRSNDTSGEGARFLGPGDFLGVVACMSGHSQIETCVAQTDTTAISVRIEQYPDLIKDNFPIAMKVIRTFAARMRLMNTMLTQLTLSNVAQEGFEHIFDVAKYYDGIGSLSIAVFAYYQYIKACPKGKYVGIARKKIAVLKNKTHAVHFEPKDTMTRRYPKNTMIFSESQSGSEMFVIQEGSVDISKIVDNNEVTLARFQKTDMFGEMALLEDKPRSANAIAHDDCVLMVINKQNFAQIVATQPQLIARLTKMLADRMWAMYRKFDNASLINPHHKMLDMLAIQIEQAMPNVGQQVTLQTDLTLNDLLTMCAIPQEMQTVAMDAMYSEPRIKLNGTKIFVPNCLEVIKQAAFNRKKNREKLQQAMGATQ